MEPHGVDGGGERTTRPKARLHPARPARWRWFSGRFRLGGHVEVAGAFVVDDGARTIDLGIETSTGREPLTRLGGLELSTGLDLSIWFDL